ncbi:unnamed protein product [Somion occarium]|uniref:Uncharacterized protein n=1 Tax=Somion occarium TaxID=3059160 RepID=A0ABP1DHA2_9APHY
MGFPSSDVLAPFYLSQAEGYVIVAFLTLWTWELLISFADDVEMFTGRRFALYDTVYVLARTTTGGLLMSTLGFLAQSGTGREPALKAVAWFEAFSLILNSLLFLFRALAVFSLSPKIKAVFGFLWLITLTAALTMPFSSTPNVRTFASVSFALVTAFDTAVFVAISLEGLGQASRALLLTGQLYYLTMIPVNTMAIIVIFSSESTFPPILKFAFVLAALAMQNIMASKVFRLLKFGRLQENASLVHMSQGERTQSICFAHQIEPACSGDFVSSVSMWLIPTTGRGGWRNVHNRPVHCIAPFHFVLIIAESILISSSVYITFTLTISHNQNNCATKTKHS